MLQRRIPWLAATQGRRRQESGSSRITYRFVQIPPLHFPGSQTTSRALRRPSVWSLPSSPSFGSGENCSSSSAWKRQWVLVIAHGSISDAVPSGRALIRLLSYLEWKGKSWRGPCGDVGDKLSIDFRPPVFSCMFSASARAGDGGQGMTGRRGRPAGSADPGEQRPGGERAGFDVCLFILRPCPAQLGTASPRQGVRFSGCVLGSVCVWCSRRARSGLVVWKY